MRDDPEALLRAAVVQIGSLTSECARTGVLHDEADDDVGTIATDSAHGFDPLPLLGALHRSGAKVVIIGQVAGILHGSAELTGDLDLLWDGDVSQADRLVDAFAAVGADLLDDDGPIELDPGAFARPKVLIESSTASGDLCSPALPWGALAVTDFIDRSLTARMADGARVHYLRRDDLIAMREAAGRPKDLRRAEELRTMPHHRIGPAGQVGLEPTT